MASIMQDLGTKIGGEFKAHRVRIEDLENGATLQGNTFNGAEQLVQLDADGKLPAIDGSQLTGVFADSTAVTTSYDNTSSGLMATDVQVAIDEVNSSKTNISIPLSKQLKGTYSLSNTVKTLAFDAITYTGKATSQEIIVPQELSGIELSSAFSGYSYNGSTFVSDGSSISQSSQDITITNVGGTYAIAEILVTLDTNKQYNISFSGVGSYQVQVGISNQSISGETSSSVNTYSFTQDARGNFNLSFTPEQTNTYIRIGINSGTISHSVLSNNISVQEVTRTLSTIDFTQASNGTGFYHDRATDDCIVKNDAGDIVESGEIAFKHFAGVDGVCKVHIKGRSNANNNVVIDGLRGKNNPIYTDTTSVEGTILSNITSFTISGYILGTNGIVNTSGATYISYITLYTHIKWGLTNQGKRYIEAYNPVTNDTMIMYQGSGIAGHQIPHSVGVKLDLSVIKQLSGTGYWDIQNGTFRMYINTTDMDQTNNIHTFNKENISLCSDNAFWNASSNTYILYGKAKSKTWTIVPYTGTGVAGNFVPTYDCDGIARRPRRVITKAITSISDWYVFDSSRPLGTSSTAEIIRLNTYSSAEVASNIDMEFNINGFTFGNTNTYLNASGVQYIALVEFDTDNTGTSGSYFDNPTNTTNLQLDDGLISISNGYNVNGADNKVVSKSGTISPIGGWL